MTSRPIIVWFRDDLRLSDRANFQHSARAFRFNLEAFAFLAVRPAG
jgi:deoxyribodipyrimidine photolyase